MDETGLNPEHNTRKVVPGASDVPGIISPMGCLATLIACSNPAGQRVPPYFVSKGVRRNEELMNGTTPGVNYEMPETSETSETGWSNSLTYDGHKSHITSDLIDCGKENNI